MMHPREKDHVLAEFLGYTVEWRLCATDPECGAWEEIEWHEEKHQEGDELWGHHPVVRQPCYNWLDTDGPAQKGWTTEAIATTDRGHYWKVVKPYSTDYNAFRDVEDEIERRGLAKFYIEALADVLDVTPQKLIEHGASCLWLFARATPEQRCEAAFRILP